MKTFVKTLSIYIGIIILIWIIFFLAENNICQEFQCLIYGLWAIIISCILFLIGIIHASKRSKANTGIIFGFTLLVIATIVAIYYASEYSPIILIPVCLDVLILVIFFIKNRKKDQIRS